MTAAPEPYLGADRVHDFLQQNHTAFPDFVLEPVRVSPTTDAVVVESWFTGTHLGPWRGPPATGKKVDFEMCPIFEFDGEEMTNEKPFFDLSKAFAYSLTHRRQAPAS